MPKTLTYSFICGPEYFVSNSDEYDCETEEFYYEIDDNDLVGACVNFAFMEFFKRQLAQCISEVINDERLMTKLSNCICKGIKKIIFDLELFDKFLSYYDGKFNEYFECKAYKEYREINNG